MILLALSLLVAIESRPLPQTAPDVTVAPATAPHGALEPPAVPPRGILGTAILGSVVVVLAHTCAG